MNTDAESPLHQHILVAAENDELLFRNKPEEIEWVVSTATIVDGILKLFSKNPRRDRDEMHKAPLDSRTRRSLSEDGTPLRRFYLENNDLAIYTAIQNFFEAVENLFWSRTKHRSYATKTVGIQAFFDILRMLLARDLQTRRAISVKYFEGMLRPAVPIDFTADYFQASGLGKTRIRNVIGYAIGLVNVDDIAPEDARKVRSLLKHAE